MGRRAHKRQKREADNKAQLASADGLGLHHADSEPAEKDDEERRLESIVFGVPFVSSKDSKKDSKSRKEDDVDDVYVHEEEDAETKVMHDADVCKKSIIYLGDFD